MQPTTSGCLRPCFHAICDGMVSNGRANNEVFNHDSHLPCTDSFFCLLTAAFHEILKKSNSARIHLPTLTWMCKRAPCLGPWITIKNVSAQRYRLSLHTFLKFSLTPFLTFWRWSLGKLLSYINFLSSLHLNFGWKWLTSENSLKIEF